MGWNTPGALDPAERVKQLFEDCYKTLGQAKSPTKSANGRGQSPVKNFTPTSRPPSTYTSKATMRGYL